MDLSFQELCVRIVFSELWVCIYVFSRNMGLYLLFLELWVCIRVFPVLWAWIHVFSRIIGLNLYFSGSIGLNCIHISWNYATPYENMVSTSPSHQRISPFLPRTPSGLLGPEKLEALILCHSCFFVRDPRWPDVVTNFRPSAK